MCFIPFPDLFTLVWHSLVLFHLFFFYLFKCVFSICEWKRTCHQLVSCMRKTLIRQKALNAFYSVFHLLFSPFFLFLLNSHWRKISATTKLRRIRWRRKSYREADTQMESRQDCVHVFGKANDSRQKSVRHLILSGTITNRKHCRCLRL